MIKNRDILILTQPLNINYGGILQAYALQSVLRRMGYNVTTDKHSNFYQKRSIFNDIVDYIHGKILEINIFGHKLPFIKYSTMPAKSRYINRHMSRFIMENMQVTELLTWRNRLNRREINKYDTFIVGSDQVWRPQYNDWQPNYFFEFIDKKKEVKRIAYAASYGVDLSEYAEELQLKCGRLLKQFDAVSVRETAGIKLTKDLFNVDAEFVLDPTMLLDKEDYNRIIDKYPIEIKKEGIMVYILDESERKKEIIQMISSKLNCEVNQVNKVKELSLKTCGNIDECVIEPIEKWIAEFRDCDFVITDSFHGTVFSLIYNKPFITIVNNSRGASRFESLLTKFNLQDRVIDESNYSGIDMISSQIDFNSVNTKLIELREKSIDFLTNAVN